ncbi:hypothetical protein [Streptomyces sp. NPDC005262]|uniref:hypothetical protein n=1 Tax=Streptomyces sp. NPDC005262 TaxID=3364710 RepID=UPI0036BA96AA
MCAALAEFIRELIVQGTNEGLDATRPRGTRLSRPPTMTEKQLWHSRPESPNGTSGPMRLVSASDRSGSV